MNVNSVGVGLDSALKFEQNASKHFREKTEIQKKIENQEKALKRRDEKFHESMLKIDHEAKMEHEKFIEQFKIESIAAINLIIRF